MEFSGVPAAWRPEAAASPRLMYIVTPLDINLGLLLPLSYNAPIPELGIHYNAATWK